MNEFGLIVDLHKSTERQGPGSIEDTLKALRCMDLPSNRLKVADLGSGTGAQSLTLAKNLNASVVAVDIFSEFLEVLHWNAEKEELSTKVQTLQASMDDLPFNDAEFDLIWSEGAIYNIGFEKGINDWSRYLKPQGYLAVSEITWLSDTRPKELEDFWLEEYPEIDTLKNKITKLEENGYELKDCFVLSEDSWLANYYEPLEKQFEPFLKRHNNSKLAQIVVDEHKFEIELYRKYKEYYSYGFYIAQKIE